MSHLRFLASLESNGLSVQEKKQKIDFQDGCHGSHLGFPIGTILAIFDLQVNPNASYHVWSQLAFGFRRRSEKKIFKMAAMAATWISDGHDFSYF